MIKHMKKSSLTVAALTALTFVATPLLAQTPPDLTRREAVQAIINYEAESSIKAYQLDEQHYFMAAPGSHFAITAGEKAGASASAGSTAADIANSVLKNTAPVGGAGDQFGAKLQVYNSIVDYLENPQDGNLNNISFAALMQSNSITKEQAEALIKLVTTPFPTPMPAIPTGPLAEVSNDDKETYAEKAAQQAMNSVAINALSEIAARRIPNQSGNSMMQVMEGHVKERFANTDWYAQIGAASQEALLREVVHMMAYQAWVNQQNFRTMEQMSAMLASMVATQAKLSSTINDLTATLNAAQMQAQDITQDIQNLEFEDE